MYLLVLDCDYTRRQCRLQLHLSACILPTLGLIHTGSEAHRWQLRPKTPGVREENQLWRYYSR